MAGIGICKTGTALRGNSMTIGVGLIGYGLSGRIFHAPFILENDSFELVSVVSRQQELVNQLAPNAQVTDDVGLMLENADVDLVVITAPNHLHYELAKQALLAGKHVLLEKPSVTRLGDIEALSQLALEQNRVLTVYQNRRFDGDFLYLKQIVENGELGQLKHLESRFDRFRPTAQARWREQPGEGTGIFWDLGPHLLDQVLHLLGEPLFIQASLASLRDNSLTTDWFDLELTYSGGLRVTLGSTPFEAGDMRRFNARFSGGSWQCLGLDPQEEALRAGQMPWEANYPDKGTEQSANQFRESGGGILKQEAQPNAGDYRAFYQALADSIVNGHTPPVSSADACRLIYALERAEESSASGQRLSWDYAPPK